MNNEKTLSVFLIPDIIMLLDWACAEDSQGWISVLEFEFDETIWTCLMWCYIQTRSNCLGIENILKITHIFYCFILIFS